jgi:hypothetical protein
MWIRPWKDFRMAIGEVHNKMRVPEVILLNIMASPCDSVLRTSITTSEVMPTKRGGIPDGVVNSSIARLESDRRTGMNDAWQSCGCRDTGVPDEPGIKGDGELGLG